MHKKIVGIAMAIVILAMCIGVVVAAGNYAENRKPPEVTGPSPGLEVSSPQGDSSPVSYTKNETFLVGSGSQIIEEISLSSLDQRAPYLNNHYGLYYTFAIRNKQLVYLVTPYSVPTKKDGVNLKVRYLWMNLAMPVGVNVTEVYVNTGSTNLYDSTNKMVGTGTLKTYMIDMGSYKSVPNGIQVLANVQNDKTTNLTVNSYGGGVRLVW